MALITGTVIQFTDGTTGTVRSMIGEGGQGEVYKIDYKGETKALKWFKEHPGPNVANSIHANIVRKATLPSYFQWPIAICDNKLGFGYVMDLVDTDKYKELKLFIWDAPNCYFKSYSAIINACLHICLAFKKLHAYGLAYFDMNHGNFFFNPENGDLIIIDTDNIAPAGHIVTSVQGTSGYMAPELVSFKIPEGVSKSEVEKYIPRPNRYTDYCSLAFVLFRIIFIDHPLEGGYLDKYPCMTPKVRKFIYGDKPVFIYDPTNDDNRPIKELSPTVMERWNQVPLYIRDAFIKAFSYENLHNPNTRLMESEWIKIFTKWRSFLCACPNCGKEVHLEYKNGGFCEKCLKSSSIYWMRIGNDNFVVPLVKGVKLFGSQLGLENKYFDEIAIIARKKSDSTMVIINSSSFDWIVTNADNSSQYVVKSGKYVELCDKMKIRFSNFKDAVIRLK